MTAIKRRRSRTPATQPQNLTVLTSFSSIANREVLKFYGNRGSCIFSTAVVCDVLAHYGFDARPLRVQATVLPTKPREHACTLGSDGDGSRQPAAGHGKWRGHLVTSVSNQYLVDTTLDQVNDIESHLRAEPVVIHLSTTDWFLCEDPKSYRYHRTGNLSVFKSSDSIVRYAEHPRQNGFKYAGDFQACRRKALAPALIAMARETFAGADRNGL
jgi:hypothetical protein